MSQTEQLHLKMTHSQEDSLTAVSWFASSDKFVCGGARGQFYQCNLEVTRFLIVDSFSVLIIFFSLFGFSINVMRFYLLLLF